MPCLASASTKAGAWLLVEHPGPWAVRPEDSRLAAPVAEVLREAGRLGIRCQLIRRSGRRRTPPPLQVYVGRSLGDVWLEGRELADPSELRGLDLRAVASGERPGFGEPAGGPLALVCVHGRRNGCCARAGVPLARALRERFGDAVWETTHVGGDRYAANLVCLPHGLYYGDLGAEQAVAAIKSYLNGKVHLERYRGRGGVPEPSQAAEHFVRSRTGVLDIDAVTVESVPARKGRLFEVTVRVRQRRYRVAVERVPVRCECEENLGTYLLRNLTLLNEAALV
jgi:hypothetical protein